MDHATYFGIVYVHYPAFLGENGPFSVKDTGSALMYFSVWRYAEIYEKIYISNIYLLEDPYGYKKKDQMLPNAGFGETLPLWGFL